MCSASCRSQFRGGQGVQAQRQRLAVVLLVRLQGPNQKPASATPVSPTPLPSPPPPPPLLQGATHARPCTRLLPSELSAELLLCFVAIPFDGLHRLSVRLTGSSDVGGSAAFVQVCRRKCCRTWGKAITELPPGFNPHRQIKKLYAQRRAMIEGDHSTPSLDWGMAEAMAFGTLLVEGGAAAPGPPHPSPARFLCIVRSRGPPSVLPPQ